MAVDREQPILNSATQIQPDARLLEFIQLAQEQRGYFTWVASRLATGPEEAEDIVQQALLKAFVNLSHFRGAAKMRTWLHTIVLNTAREHLRNGRRRVPLRRDPLSGVEDEEGLRDLPCPRISPEDYCAGNEAAAILHAEIDLLTPDCKHAVELCVMHELPYREAAKELSTNISTLKSRIYRAKGMLKRAMDQRNYRAYKSASGRTPMAGDA